VAETSISTHRTSDGGVIVGIRGELDIGSAERLRSVILHAVNASHPPWLVVDLLYTTLLDSAGIGALIAGYNAMRAIGGRFTVSSPNPLVYQQLRVTGLVDVLGAGPQPPSQRYNDRFR
jgi:anti-anti-sigma factor